MAKRKTTKRKSRKKKAGTLREIVFAWVRFGAMVFLWAIVGVIGLVFLFAFINPPAGIYMTSERMRLGSIKREWVQIEDIAPVVVRTFVAAEDANFCEHFGFDLTAIRAVVAGGKGSLRGASTITQQVSRNVFLWLERSWVRKGLEAGVTLLVETVWTKRRILEVYLNVAELDEGVFGIAAAGTHYFGVDPKNMTAIHGGRLAALLPDPKNRSPIRLTPYMRKRSLAIIDGAATILADGRADCFQ